MTLLQVSNLAKTYENGGSRTRVFAGVSFALDPGEAVALTGESGCGKSTLLHICAGLDDPDDGSVSLAGVALAGLGDANRAALRRNRIGLVFQQFNLIPSLRVADNLSFQARLIGREDVGWSSELARRLGLSAKLNHYPEQLSGGQQQRLAIGRALAGRPSLILADEPTGNLDEKTGDEVLELFLELVRETGAGLLMVTHSSRLASRLGRRLHLSDGALS